MGSILFIRGWIMASTENILAILGTGSSQKKLEKMDAFMLTGEEARLDQPQLKLANQHSLADVLENCLSATKKSDCTPQS